MLTNLQKHKFTALFHHEDLNHDGYYEQADHEEFARRICEAFEFRPGSPEHERVYTAVGTIRRQEKLREFYEARDYRLTLDDYLELTDRIVHDEEMMVQLTTNHVQSILGLWDRDKDGRLSREEYISLEWCYGVDETGANEAFRHLDRDVDGYITVDEGIAAVREFYLSDDPNAPGNWLFGPY